MKRFAINYLKEWALDPFRKPLLLRGARQVGKTHLVRQFAACSKLDLVELNFEEEPDLNRFFVDPSPEKIIPLLEMRFGKSIEPGKCLLFFDEVQTAPQVIKSLRYFKEKLPSQHVVAAGSLLDFVLSQEGASIPVGRVQYLYIGPMTFSEFLNGVGQNRLADFISTFQLGDSNAEAMHEHLMMWFRRYLMIGGMPEAVDVFRETGSLLKVDQIKEGLLNTYRDDFSKYRGRLDDETMRLVFNKIPGLVGGKLKFVNISREMKSSSIATVIDRLCRAGVMCKISHTSANGLPIGAEANPKLFKPLFLDVGLMMRAMGLDLTDVDSNESLMLVNRGAIAEQVVGQEFLAARPIWEEPRLFYWLREKKTSSAEVDYLIVSGTSVIPVEVKAGATGRLKSLHVFLNEKGRDFGVRLGSGLPLVNEFDLKLPAGQRVKGRLLSVPLYLASEVGRLVKELI